MDSRGKTILTLCEGGHGGEEANRRPVQRAVGHCTCRCGRAEARPPPRSNEAEAWQRLAKVRDPSEMKRAATGLADPADGRPTWLVQGRGSNGLASLRPWLRAEEQGPAGWRRCWWRTAWAKKAGARGGEAEDGEAGGAVLGAA